MRQVTGILSSATSSIKKYSIRKKYSEDAIAGRTAESISNADLLPLIMNWLCTAQDLNLGGDRGVSRHYSLLDGWAYSYPETTGYILETFINMAKKYASEKYFKRAKEMADWLVKIQLECGGFTGSTINRKSDFNKPVVFNTGQILIGYAAAINCFGGEYENPMCRAADWLISVQEKSGNWIKGSSPVARAGYNTYYTHVAYGLLEAAKVMKKTEYADAALNNLSWALNQQTSSGWFRNCCLSDPSAPLTHTIGYTIRGIWEGYEYSKDKKYLDSVTLAADEIVNVFKEYGSLPGRLNKNWKPAVQWQCLTGNSQIAIVLIKLYKETGKKKYLAVANNLLKIVKSTILISGDTNILGAVKGSEPIQGQYCSYQYPNWAAKFTTDCIMELEGVN